MDRRDRRDQRDMRPHHAHERRDLAGVVHADLEHAEARVRRHARQRQRHAPVIVVGRGGGVRLAAGRRASTRSISLTRRLADRAGHRDDLRLRARARGDAEPLHGAQRVLDREHRAESGELAALARADDDRGRGAGLEGARDVIVAVCASPLIAKKRSPGSKRARVDRHAAESRQAARSARRRARRASSASVQSAVMPPPPAPRAPRPRRRTATSCRRRSGPSHGPCRRSPARRLRAASRRPRGSPRRGRRSRCAGGAAARICGADRGGILGARIVVGDDRRRRRARVAISPIIGRLPASRSPPQPNTTISRPRTKGRSAASAFSSASGLCA